MTLSRAAFLTGLRLIIALAVMLSVAPSLRGGALSYQAGALQALHVADLGEVDRHLHSHSHDDEDGDGPTLPFHTHEHTDHSHVTLGLPTAPASVTGPEGRLVRRQDDCRLAAHPLYQLDRPPCLASFA
jgi:hypothetical protein